MDPRTLLRLAVVGCLTLIPATVFAQGQSIDGQFVPDDAFVAFYLQPKTVLGKPEMAMVPREVVTAFSEEAIGVDPVHMSSLLIFLRLPSQPGPPHWGAVATFSKPQTLKGSYLDQCELQQVDGKPYYVNEGFDNPPCFYAASDTMILAGDAATVPKMLTSKMSDSALIQMLGDEPVGAADLQILVAWNMLRPMFLEEMETAGPPPPPFGQLVDVGRTLESIRAHFDLGVSIKGRVELQTTDAKSAQETGEILQGFIDFGETMIVSQAKAAMANETDTMSRAMSKYIERMGDEISDSLAPKIKGDTVTIEIEDHFAQTGVVVALLLPAVQSAREAARRAASANNLKQIAIAMHMYHDTNNTFPGQASVDAKGKSLLSWRVHLLPYLDQQKLYDQFHLDEPWDSEHNIKLAEKMPAVFANPNLPSNSKTVYMALASPDGIMNGKLGRSLRDITDGSSNTIMFVEANADQAVTWTRPEDLKYDPARPLQGLGTLRPNGFQAAACDGSVRFISLSINPDVMRAMVTAQGGEAIEAFPFD